jgi:hypothetical protein
VHTCTHSRIASLPPSSLYRFVNAHNPDTHTRHYTGERHPRLQTSHIAHKTGSNDDRRRLGQGKSFCKFLSCFFQLINCFHSFLGSKHVVTTAAPHPVPPPRAPARRATTDRKRITGTENNRRQGQGWETTTNNGNRGR